MRSPKEPLRAFDVNTILKNFLSLFHLSFSFAILVVFLKVLLKQQGLDKPFTGGLGSYALYVLVARHVSVGKF